MAHTPGEWKSNDNGACVYRETGKGRDILAHVYGTTRNKEKGRVEQTDNANLMAASPNLLQSVEDLLALIHVVAPQFDDSVYCDAARAAIAKVKGEQK